MAFQLALALESMAVIVCIHRLYDKKVKFDIGTMLLYLGCLIIFNVVNMYGFSSSYTVAVYVLTGIYCVCRYKDSVRGAVLSVLLIVAVMDVMQFLCAWPVDFIFRMGELKRAVAVNTLVLISCIFVLPKCGLNKLRSALKRVDIYIFVLVGFALAVVFAMQLQVRIYGKLYSELFVLVIPAITLLFLLAVKWITVQNEKYNIERELQVTVPMREKYDELLKTVRLRQHEFKNHLSAIMSAHYTYNSYDKWEKAQKEYCNELIRENRYSNLLVLKDSVLAGFLYSKFQEMEAEGIDIECKFMGEFQQTEIPMFYLVEMLGILLDNAAQAVQNKELKKVVNFAFIEQADRFLFSVSNRFPHVSYEEIEKWFQMGNSTKGEGRGIGLYHIKCLCEETGCDILCRNTVIEGENWIEFILVKSKADMK